MQAQLQSVTALLQDLLRLSLWLVLLVVILVPLEKRCGLYSQKFFRKAFRIDLAYYFLGALIPKLLLILPISLLAAEIHRLPASGYYAYMASLPMSIRLPLAMVAGEIGAYWAHRISHQVPLLWRFHAIHHSAEEMDWLVNSRAHPVDLFITRLFVLIPQYVLGLAQPLGNSVDLVPVLVTVIGTFWGFLIHANLKWRFGWLEFWIASPAFHHWHHNNDGADTVDKNFAPMLPWVDKLFGTFYLPAEIWPQTYGINQQMPETLTGQMLEPLLNPGYPQIHSLDKQSEGLSNRAMVRS